MDIAVVQAALSNFSTFVDNVIELFQGFPEFIKDFAEFFEPAFDTVDKNNDGKPDVDAAGDLVTEPVEDEDGKRLNNGAHWANQTSSIFKKD